MKKIFLLSLVLGVAASFPLWVKSSSANIVDSTTEDTSDATISTGKGGGDCNQLQSVTFPVRAGKRAFKHWVDRCGERSELEFKKTKIGETYWLGWSMFLPETWENGSRGYDIVSQWAAYPTERDFRSGGGCGAVGSRLSIGGSDLVFKFQRQGDETDIECDNFSLGNIDQMKGKWVDFVMNVKWTGNRDGFLKLWMKIDRAEYVQKIDYKGPTFWNDEGSGPYFKMGNYKGEPDFKGPAPRMLYTDEYRLGNASSSFKEVAPGGL